MQDTLPHSEAALAKGHFIISKMAICILAAGLQNLLLFTAKLGLNCLPSSLPIQAEFSGADSISYVSSGVFFSRD